MSKLAILIPTRNRPNQTSELLRSITQSSLRPEQVIVVASGQDISDVIKNYESILPLTYIFTDIRGQIAQKKIGVAHINANIDWCLFLDDDLLLDKDTIKNAFFAASSYPKSNIIGIGLSLTPTSRYLNFSPFTKKLLKFFKLSALEPGRVLTSGHATSYLEQEKVIETQWLNGASVWKTDYVRLYGQGLPSTPYAACEDLIFSYPLSKCGTLVYAPEARLRFQSTSMTDYNNFKVIQSASFWRFYFVSNYPEFSIKWFFISQFVRMIFAVKDTKKNRLKLFLQLCHLNFVLLKSYFLSIQPLELLIAIESQDSSWAQNSN